MLSRFYDDCSRSDDGNILPTSGEKCAKSDKRPRVRAIISTEGVLPRGEELLPTSGWVFDKGILALRSVLTSETCERGSC